MKIELYQELFEHAAFPVFAIGANGRVVYKNLSAGKYLPMIRKNAIAKRHLYPPELTESMPVTISGNTPYEKAIALKDEDGFLVLSFSRLQYGDGDEVAKLLLRNAGDTAMDFFLSLKKECSEDGFLFPPNVSRIYADLLRVMRTENAFYEVSVCSLHEIVSAIFGKLHFGFRALGYRIRTEIRDSFREEYPVRFCLQDFLFVFGKLLYLLMKLSENGVIAISLASDAHRASHILRIETKTQIEREALSQLSPKDFLMRYMPECAPEIFILKQSEVLAAEMLFFEADRGGKLSVEYRIPYLERASYFVRSVSPSSALLAMDIDLMLRCVRKRLKDNGASY